MVSAGLGLAGDFCTPPCVCHLRSSSGDSRGGRASLSLRVTSRGAGPLSLVAQGSENESPRRLSLAVLVLTQPLSAPCRLVAHPSSPPWGGA